MARFTEVVYGTANVSNTISVQSLQKWVLLATAKLGSHPFDFGLRPNSLSCAQHRFDIQFWFDIAFLLSTCQARRTQARYDRKLPFALVQNSLDLHLLLE